jgi:hypothetical protein
MIKSRPARRGVPFMLEIPMSDPLVYSQTTVCRKYQIGYGTFWKKLVEGVAAITYFQFDIFNWGIQNQFSWKSFVIKNYTK